MPGIDDMTTSLLSKNKLLRYEKSRAFEWSNKWSKMAVTNFSHGSSSNIFSSTGRRKKNALRSTTVIH